MKKYFSTLFAAVGLFLALSQPVQASRWVPYTYPQDIKNEFCGVHIDFRYCKCAFHGQYCDELGIDSAASNSWVYSQWDVWKEKMKSQFMTGCLQGGGIAKDNGCLWCEDKGEFNWQGECGNIAELCSEDPNVTFNTETARCECRVGFNLLSDKTCESICPTDVPGWTYDPDSNRCICAKGYEPAKDEEGNDYCKEAPEVTLWVTFSEGKTPLLADGETKAELEVEIFDTVTGNGVDAEFTIGYTNAAEKGEITDIKKTGAGKYTLSYQTADLTDQVKSGVFEDKLYVFYQSKKEGKQIYKVKPIPLAVGLKVPVMIRKPGYNDYKDTIIFTGSMATISVTTKTVDGEEFDVAGAQAALADSYETFKGDEEGMITLFAPEDIESDITSEMDVVLEMSAEAYDDMRDTSRNVSKIAEIVDTNYDAINNFIDTFPEELAAAPDFKKAEQLLSGMKRTKYALFHILRGEDMLNGTTKGIADTIKDQMWDFLDYIDLLGKVLDYISTPFTKALGEYFEKGLDYINEHPKEFLAHIEKVLDNEWVAYFTGLVEADEVEKMMAIHNFLQKATNITDWLFENVINAYQDAVKSKAFNFKEDWFGSLLSEVRNKTTAMGVKWGWDKVSFENFIQSYFRGKYQDVLTTLVDIVNDKVARGNWDTIGTEADLMLAKWELNDLMMWYDLAVRQDVRITEHKAYIEGFMDVVVTPLKFTVIFKDVASAIENFYKIFKMGILNNDVLFRYIDATGVVINDMTKAVNQALGGGPQAYAPSFFPFAYAQEAATAEDVEKPEILENPYDEAMQQKLEDYSVKGGELDLSIQLKELTDLALEAFPDEDGSLKSYQEELSGKINTLESETETLKTELAPIIKDLESVKPPKSGCLNELDVNCDGKVDLKDITAGEWVAMGVVVLILYFIIKGIRRLFRRKKK
ncbi:hypothetical protein JW752_00880 [Candidatus Peregrinibacteria bacterium]|nr:hypothetical protein [Candidatus Peregrinibacteria bacterium]